MNSHPIVHLLFLLCAGCGVVLLPSQLQAQGGPPLLTDDANTVGNQNWEINVAYTADRRLHQNTYEAPLLDINYGVGDRIQLKYEIPYLHLTSDQGGSSGTGLGNSLVGMRWRFYGNDKTTWKISTYPQLEFNNPTHSARRGFVGEGTNFLLPVEVNKQVGPLEVNFEAGYWFSQNSPDGHFLGLAVGHQATKKLEVLSEIYHSAGLGEVRDEKIDFGGRFDFRHNMTFLFMAGRCLHSADADHSSFIGYFGIQFRLEKTHRE